MKYVFFDTETTGVPKNYNAPVSNVENWPRLVQLGFVQFDSDQNKTSEMEMIVFPSDFVIPEEAALVHGITQEKAMKNGFNIKIVIDMFFDGIGEDDVFIGHNVSFDMGIVGAEYYRLYGKDPFAGRKSICTMKSSTGFCKLPGYNGKYKWPKLFELYQALFGESLSQTHTALDDIQNTAKCYFALVERGVIK